MKTSFNRLFSRIALISGSLLTLVIFQNCAESDSASDVSAKKSGNRSLEDTIKAQSKMKSPSNGSAGEFTCNVGGYDYSSSGSAQIKGRMEPFVSGGVQYRCDTANWTAVNQAKSIVSAIVYCPVANFAGWVVGGGGKRRKGGTAAVEICARGNGLGTTAKGQWVAYTGANLSSNNTLGCDASLQCQERDSGGGSNVCVKEAAQCVFAKNQGTGALCGDNMQCSPNGTLSVGLTCNMGQVPDHTCVQPYSLGFGAACLGSEQTGAYVCSSRSCGTDNKCK